MSDSEKEKKKEDPERKRKGPRMRLCVLLENRIDSFLGTQRLSVD